MKNIRSLWDETVKKYGPLTALKWLNKKEPEEITYEDLGKNVKKLRRGLETSGFAGAHIALIGGSSPEWIASYLALVTIAVIIVEKRLFFWIKSLWAMQRPFWKKVLFLRISGY